MTQPVFEERQRPPAAVIVLGAVVTAAAIVFAVVVSDRLGEVRWQLFFGPAFAVAVFVLVRMTTTVTASEVRMTMVPFPRKRWPVAELEGCEVVTYRPLLHYGGWGWKWSRKRGPAYTMRGTRGVMVRRTNGKQFLIGSERPEDLASAIEAAIRQGRPSAA